MFLDFDGNVIDYFNGIDDLKNKLIRFVGDPGERIREDYLRIFRYFRFYVRYGCLTKHEDETIAAIRSNSQGLHQISGERIWSEMKRILQLKDCVSIIPLLMNDLRMGQFMGISSHPVDVKHFESVWDALFRETPQPRFEAITALTALIKDMDEMNACANRLKFSKMERFTAAYIITNRCDVDAVSLKSLMKQLAVESKSQQDSVRRFMCQFLRYIGRYDILNEIESWQIPDFPDCGHLLKGKMDKKPKRLFGEVVDALKREWAKNDYVLDEESAKQIIDQKLNN